MRRPDDNPLAAQAASACGQAARGWVVVALLLLLQFGLFFQFAHREVVWGYPTCHDQTVYLLQSYETYQHILDEDLLRGLSHGSRIFGATTAVFHLQASLLFLVLGPSRFSALVLNFLYFALLQIVLAGTLRRLTGRWSVALAGVGLLLTALTPFYYAGGVTDFRIDFLAFCLYGVLICLVLRSGVFASRRWSLAVGAVAGWLVLNRFITFVYLTGVLAVMLAYLALRAWRRRADPGARRPELRRLTGLALAGLVLAGIALPVLWQYRDAIVNYYVVGHVTGPEKYIRAQQFGGDNPYGYYPHSLLVDHAGPVFLVLCGLVLAAGLGLAAVGRGRTVRPAGPPVLSAGPAFFFLGTSLVVPLLVLAANMSRSPIVGNIALPALVWLVMLTLTACLGLHRPGRGPRSREHALAVLAAVVVAAGLAQQFHRYGHTGPLTKDRAEVARLLGLYDEIGRCCRDYNWNDPVISTNCTADYCNYGVARVLLYERLGMPCAAKPGLGNSLFEVKEADALAMVRGSDFVLLTDPVPPQYPFEKSMRAIRRQLRAVCEREFVRRKAIRFGGTRLTLYVRHTLRLEGDSQGWVTSRGMTLRGTGADLRGHTTVRMRGMSQFDWLDRLPTVTARLKLPGQAPRKVRATLTDRGKDYLLELDLKNAHAPAKAPVSIRLTFDRYFVPKRHGLGDDARRLVIRTPRRTELIYH
jgi:hypothetical protein